MDLLERECQQYVGMAPSERPPQVVMALTSLITQLNIAAQQSPNPSAALVLLERAELWGEQLEKVMASLGASGTTLQQVHGPASRLSVLLAKNKTLTTLRDVLSTNGQWQQAIKYARQANTLDEEICDIVSTAPTATAQHHLQKLAPPGAAATAGYTVADRLELSRLVHLYNPLRIAKNQMNLCVLFSKIQRHHEASQHASTAVALLHAILAQKQQQYATEAPGSGSGKDTPDADAQAAAAENSPQALLAGAYYNYGAQLECVAGRGREAQAAYNAGLDCALAHLGKKHPLTVRLAGIVRRSIETPGAGGSHHHHPQQQAAALSSALPTVHPKGPTAFFIARPPLATPPTDGGQRRAASQQGPRKRQGPPLASVAGARPPTAPDPTEAALAGAGGSSFHRGRWGTPLEPLGGTFSALEPGTISSSGSFVHNPSLAQSMIVGSSFRSQSSPMKAPAVGTVTAVAWDEDDLGAMRPKRRGDEAATEVDLVSALRRASSSVQVVAPASGGAATTAAGGSNTGDQQQQQQQVPSAPKSPVRSPSRTMRGASTKSAASASGDERRNSSARRGSFRQREENIQELTAQRLAQWTAEATRNLFHEYTTRYEAALRIQRAWKCSQCRLEVYNRRQLFYHHLHTQQAAAVQAITSFLRMLIQKRRRLAEAAQRRAEQLVRVGLEQKRDHAAIVLTRNGRLYLQRKHHTERLMRVLQLQQEEKLRQYDIAVITQRWWRQVRQQKAYWRRRQTEFQAAVQQKIEAEKLRRAAISIQRIVRGVQGRVYFATFRIMRLQEIKEYRVKVHHSTNLIKVVLRELRHRQLRLQREKELEISRKDQDLALEKASWDDAVRRRAVADAKLLSMRLSNAVIRIQRFVRLVRSRRELKHRKRVQKATGSLRIDREFRERRAAITVQCIFRKALAKNAVQRKKASFGRRLLLATRLAQRIGRGYLQGRAVMGPVYGLAVRMTNEALAVAKERQRRLVTMLQCAGRAALSVQIAVQLRCDLEAEEALVYRRFMSERRQDEAAAKIQSVARMRRDKKDVDAMREELRALRMRVLAAVCRIQRAIRVALAKVVLKRKRLERDRRRQQLLFASQLQHEMFVLKAKEFETLSEMERMHISEAEVQHRLDIGQMFLVRLAEMRRGGGGGAGGGGGMYPQPENDCDLEEPSMYEED